MSLLNSLVVLLLGYTAPSVSVHVEGDGYLRFVKDGRSVYSREATLTIQDGRLADSRGPLITPSLFVSGEPDAILIEPNGTICISVKARKVVIGRLLLVRLSESSNDGDGFLITNERGISGLPGQAGMGTILTSNSSRAATKSVAQPIKLNSQGIQIDVRSKSEVPGDQFSLGEIAEIVGNSAETEQLKKIVIGDTPSWGVPRGIDATRIRARLLSAHFSAAEVSVNVPSGAVVYRKGQQITAEQIMAEGKRAVAEKLGNIELDGTTESRPITVPLGELQVYGEAVNNAGNRVGVTVVVKVDGNRITSRTLMLTIARSNVGIKSGEMVKIAMVSGGVTVQLQGRAKSSGYVGQTIQVVTESGATLAGRITGANEVEVTL